VYDGIFVDKPYTYDVYVCMRNSGYRHATAVLKWQNGQYDNKLLTYDLNDQFPITDVALVLSGFDNLQVQLDTYLQDQAGATIAKTWIVVAVIDGFKPPCSFIQTAVSYLSEKTRNVVGVRSKTSDWAAVFGSLNNCSQLYVPSAFWNSSRGNFGSKPKSYRQSLNVSQVVCNINYEVYTTV